MDIKHDLLPKQKRRKQGLKVTIDLFPLATELYQELEKLGLIERLKDTKQLGDISVPKRLEKTRYDYVILQLYCHQIIRQNIQNELKYSYNNRLKPSDLLYNHEMQLDDISEKNPVTLADVMQILVIMYNIGHFYNTFVASRAVLMMALHESSFYDSLLNASLDPRYNCICKKVIDGHNYQRIHLLNSLLILERCNQSKKSVRIAKELLLAYLDENDLASDSRLHEYFKLFRKVRTASFVAYDLQIARVPFTIDLWNKDGLTYFFREYLAEFNNNYSSTSIIREMAAMLSSTVYNEQLSSICSTQISKKMVKRLCNNTEYSDYYSCWADSDSILNIRYPQKHDYDSQCLKLTFKPENRLLAEKLYYALDHQNSTRAGFYIRHNGEITIVISIRKKCTEKQRVAFKVLKTVVSFARQMGLNVDDPTFILTTKFFLFYLFNQRQLFIKPVVHDTKCVLCTKGKNSRIKELRKIIVNGSEDEKHEIEAMIAYLQKDPANDTTITVSGSTVVYKKKGEATSEFDGIIIFPNRDKNQIVLLEAKNMDYRPGYGKSCLNKKLKNLGMTYEYKDIIVFDHDAYYCISV